MTRIPRRGLNVAHYAAQDSPLFELVEGEGDRTVVHPLFSIPEIRLDVRERHFDGNVKDS